MNPLYILLGLIALVILYAIAKYNGMVSMRNRREQSFGDIDAQLQQRFDLVPNLVETVKGYAKHESETLEKVVAARTAYMGAGSTDDKVDASNMLTGALKSIFALSESYPDLKANTGFMQFQSELSDLENKLAAARRFFNAATAEYNTYIEMFPANLIAGVFGFKRAPGFEVDDRETVGKAPKVSF
ncbi:MAG: LemA family protein [Patescibacteria group bacterium]